MLLKLGEMFKPRILILSALSLVFLTVSGCIEHDTAELKEREAYTICFSSEGGAKKFREYLVSYARKEGMDVFDRGEEAQRELASLDHAKFVRDSTNEPLILMTIEEKDRLRVSITNAALGNDLNLTFRYRTKPRPDEASTILQFVNQEYRTIPIDESRSGSLPCANS